MKQTLIIFFLFAVLSVAAQAHEYRDATIACKAKGSYQTYQHPKPIKLRSEFKFKISVEADETGALIPSMIKLPLIAGAPIGLSAAGLKTVTWHYNGYVFPWDSSVPSVNILLSSEQVQAVMLALNKGRQLELPNTDLSQTLGGLALARKNPFSGAKYGVEWISEINFPDGTRTDGLSYGLAISCYIDKIND